MALSRLVQSALTLDRDAAHVAPVLQPLEPLAHLDELPPHDRPDGQLGDERGEWHWGGRLRRLAGDDGGLGGRRRGSPEGRREGAAVHGQHGAAGRMEPCRGWGAHAWGPRMG